MPLFLLKLNLLHSPVKMVERNYLIITISTKFSIFFFKIVQGKTIINRSIKRDFSTVLELVKILSKPR